VVVADLDEGVQLPAARAFHVEYAQGSETGAHAGHAGPAAVAMEFQGFE
jgi:hypothetical protein